MIHPNILGLCLEIAQYTALIGGIHLLAKYIGELKELINYEWPNRREQAPPLSVSRRRGGNNKFR